MVPESESGIINCLDLELNPESDDYVGVRVGAGVEWVPGLGAGVGVGRKKTDSAALVLRVKGWFLRFLGKSA